MNKILNHVTLTYLLFALLLSESVLIPTAAAEAQEAKDLSQTFTMLSWRNIGPDIGGRSIAVAGSMKRPNEYYFGATGGGLWKTTDGGGEWFAVTDGQIQSASVGAIAVNPDNPDVLYIGMGEGQLRGNVLQGDGVYKSIDAGRSWQHAGLNQTKTITTLRIHPDRTNVIYAAALGDPFSPNSQRGIYRSTDAGDTWKKILFISERTGVIDLAMDPSNPDTLFATAWQVYRKPWQLWSGGDESGLYRSTDGGDTWQNITDAKGLPQTVLGKMTVAISPADSNRIYANIEAQAGGLYRSDDAGLSWQHINGDRKLWQRSFYFMQLRPDPVDADTVYVLSFGLEKSVDGGVTFNEIPTRHVDIHDLWIDPENPARMVVGDDGGGSVTVNGGASWTLQDYPTAQMYRASVTSDFPYHVCGAQQDNRSVCIPNINPHGINGFNAPFAPYYHVSGSEMGHVVQHPGDPDIFFTGATNQLLRFNRVTGEIRDVAPYPYLVMGQPADTMRERWNWTYPIVFDPKPPHAIYIGSQHVWRSMDQGASWDRLSQDLTRAEPETLGETGGPILKDQDGPEVYATLYSLAISPISSKEIWSGSDDGLVHLSRDAGERWQNVTPAMLPAHSRISAIAPSPHHAGTAYLVAKRYEMGDRSFYVFKTNNFGQSWTRIDQTLPGNDFGHSLQADPFEPGLLYLGSESGVYVSFDDGKYWQSLSLNLPNSPITGMQVKDNDLVVATHGRSFWILEGLATLRDLRRRSGSIENPILFSPARAIRHLKPAQLDFFLPTRAEEVQVDILDTKGAVVRQLRPAHPLDEGAHRLTWDLRHDGATIFEGMILESMNPIIGPLAVPGQYLARLSIQVDIDTKAGLTLQQPIVVHADPRSDASEKALKSQLDFSLTVRDAITLANQTVIDIRALRERIETAPEKPESQPARLAFLEASAEIEAHLYQVKNASPKDKIAYPIQLNDRLAHLNGAVVLTADAPTQAQRQVLDTLLEELEVHIQAWQDLNAEALEDLNL
ncbi:MAG: glycosyl hydrolase [Pseudomonadota bacterium]